MGREGWEGRERSRNNGRERVGREEGRGHNVVECKVFVRVHSVSHGSAHATLSNSVHASFFSWLQKGMMLQNIAAVWTVKVEDVYPELLVGAAVHATHALYRVWWLCGNYIGTFIHLTGHRLPSVKM